MASGTSAVNGLPRASGNDPGRCSPTALADVRPALATTKRGNGGMPLPQRVAEAFSEHLPPTPPSGRTRAHDGRGPIRRSNYNARAGKPAVEAAGLPATRENGMHALRHHHASVPPTEGVSIRALAAYLGPKDPGSTLCGRVKPSMPPKARRHGRRRRSRPLHHRPTEKGPPSAAPSRCKT